MSQHRKMEFPVSGGEEHKHEPVAEAEWKTRPLGLGR